MFNKQIDTLKKAGWLVVVVAGVLAFALGKCSTGKSGNEGDLGAIDVDQVWPLQSFYDSLLTEKNGRIALLEDSLQVVSKQIKVGVSNPQGVRYITKVVVDTRLRDSVRVLQASVDSFASAPQWVRDAAFNGIYLRLPEVSDTMGFTVSRPDWEVTMPIPAREPTITLPSYFTVSNEWYDATVLIQNGAGESTILTSRGEVLIVDPVATIEIFTRDELEITHRVTRKWFLARRKVEFLVSSKNPHVQSLDPTTYVIERLRK